MFHHAELIARWVPASMKNECDSIQAFLVGACSYALAFTEKTVSVSNWFPTSFTHISQSQLDRKMATNSHCFA